MAIKLTSNSVYTGRVEDLPTDLSPMPPDALLYADFRDGVYVTHAARGGNGSIALDATGMQIGWYWGADGDLAKAEAGTLARIDHNPITKARLGLLIEGTTRNKASNVTDLTAGTTLSNVSVALDEALSYAYKQWFALTAASGSSAKRITFTGGACNNNDRLIFAVEIAPGAAQFVQLGLASGDPTDYVNFDVVNGVVGPAPNVGITGYMVPTAEGYRCAIKCNANAAQSDLAPWVAVVDSLTAVAGDASAVEGVAAKIRLPQTTNEAPTVSVAPLSFVWAATTTRNSDSVRLRADLIAETADLTLALMLRAPDWEDATASRSLVCLYGSSTSGISLRSDGAGGIALIAGAASVLHTFAAPYVPGRSYRVGLSRAGTTITVQVDGEAVTVTNPAASGALRIGRGLDAVANAWGGHLQRVVAWPGASTPRTLRERVAAVL